MRPAPVCRALAFLLFASVCTVAQPASPKPARVVTRYAITATQDINNQDPKDWRLLGSNDDGKSWSVLDVKTNQVFQIRSQRRLFAIANRTPYNIYRLQVDDGAQPQTNALNRIGIQIAELELMGDPAGVPSEEELHSVITASNAHPLLGPAENAFDSDSTTQWVDFGLGSPGGCWIQCQYGLQPEVLVTSVRELKVRERLSSLRVSLNGKGPQIRASLAAEAAKPHRTLRGYALTSANDVPTRDPRDWRLLGSNDGGKSWTTLDTRRHEIFATRFQRRVFTLTNQTACALYRLLIEAAGVPNSNVQLAEVEPLYSEPESDSLFSMVVSARTENPPFESVEMAFDRDSKTKWLSLNKVSSGQSTWIQWQTLPPVGGLPVFNARLLNPLADIAPKIVSNLEGASDVPVRALSGYALTSANDNSERDPRDWRLLGSNDRGKTWAVLDSRQNEVFAGRSQRRLFNLPKPARSAIYRLQIDSVRNPRFANSVQIAEIEPLLAPGATNVPFSILVSAQGENPVTEAAEMAFDGDPKTKWLDFADGKTNKASWFQWEYLPPEEMAVINLSQLRAARSRVPPPVQLNLTGVVASISGSSNLGFLDETGFQSFALGASPTNVQAGDRVVLRGRVQFGGE